MPSSYEEPPDLLLTAEFYWQAFNDLSSSRQVGMGLGPIPFIAYAEYARIYGIEDADRFDDLRRTVVAVDSEYLRLNEPKGKPDEN